MADEQELAALKAQVEKLTESVGKLEGKRDELLDENRGLKRRLTEAEEARAQADEEARAKAEEAAKASGNAEEIQRAVEARYKGQLEKAQREAQEATTQYHQHLVQGALRDAMKDVPPAMFKGASSHFKDGRAFEVKDGQAFVDGVPVAEAVNEWMASEGAVYKAAGQATGGGAPGGGKSGGKTLAEMTQDERMKLASENPEQFRALRAAST